VGLLVSTQVNMRAVLITLLFASCLALTCANQVQ
jgi:hypothetical protein